MGKYTSKYTGQQIDDKLDSIGNGGIEVITLSGTSGTFDEATRVKIAAAPQNFAFKWFNGSYNTYIFQLEEDNTSSLTYTWRGRGASGDANRWVSITVSTGVWQVSSPYSVRTSCGNQITLNATIPSGTTPTALKTILKNSNYYSIPDAPTVIKLADGSFTSYTAKSIATLISEGYNYVRLTGYSQYADKCQVDAVIKLSDVQSGSVEIQKAIPG